jgi:hypothetical protein
LADTPLKNGCLHIGIRQLLIINPDEAKLVGMLTEASA